MRYLSHTLFDGSPVYGGTASLEIHRQKSITAGDSCNVYRFCIENHWGTHVDLPNHFFEKGKKVADHPPEFWFFNKPYVADVSLASSEILRAGEWIRQVGAQNDILLIRSGWSSRRSGEDYVLKNPGIHPDVAEYLRKERPSVRAVGIDWISVSSYTDRQLGRQTHKAFLDPDGPGKPIALIEDMDMSGDMDGIGKIFVAPMMVGGIDSAPCTIIGGI